MNITKESILGVGMGTSLGGINWLRPNTPYTKDGKEKLIDCVEFEISHRGIEKLERIIHDESEYIMCFVHFNAGTDDLEGIYMSIWNEDASIDDPIDTSILDEDEKAVIIEYALKELNEEYR